MESSNNDNSMKDMIYKYRERIDNAITEYYKEEAKRRDYTSSFYRKIHANMEDFVLSGGKRLRPLLLLLGYMGYSPEGTSPDKAIKAAAAVEIFHSFLLVHDDIVDKDDMRRGKPAMHMRLAPHIPPGITKPQDIAIITGDMMLFHSLALLYETPLESHRVMNAARIMTDAAISTAIGEIYDLLDNNKSLTKTEFEHILFVMTYKTSRYTISMPLAMGAALAGSNKKYEDFEEIANLLGVAFQLQDDLLGVFGDTQKIGKSVTSDIEEGKKTLIMKWLYDDSTEEEREFLLDNLGKGTIDKDSFEKIRELIILHGIKDRIEKYIDEMLVEAREEVKGLGMNDQGTKFLLYLIDILAGREK
ncbi:MAG: polyprenyl synthetase family protein [Candidatus Woesearchaeota archaeon]